jgi:hypothetical protein
MIIYHALSEVSTSYLAARSSEKLPAIERASGAIIKHNKTGQEINSRKAEENSQAD